MCVNACPLGNVSFSAGKIVKCELCGGDPGCVKYCPSGCLVYSDEGDALGRKKAMALALKDVFGKEAS
jgi:Fe-S-cluster-containing hydrogenase component 2